MYQPCSPDDLLAVGSTWRLQLDQLGKKMNLQNGTRG